MLHGCFCLLNNSRQRIELPPRARAALLPLLSHITKVNIKAAECKVSQSFLLIFFHVFIKEFFRAPHYMLVSSFPNWNFTKLCRANSSNEDTTRQVHTTQIEPHQEARAEPQSTKLTVSPKY